MPAKQLPADFFSKYGDQIALAIRQTAAEPAKPQGLVNLPAGVTGIAQVFECYFGEGKDGKGDFWRCGAKVVVPLYHGMNGSQLPIAGLVTSAVVQINPNDVGASYAHIGNYLKLLAGDKVLAGMPKEAEKVGPFLAALSDAIAKKGPYTRFSTRLGKPTPEYPTARVWEDWQGSAGLEGYKPATAQAPTAPASASGLDATNPAVKPTAPAKPASPKPVSPPPPPPPPVQVAEPEEDVLALIDKAKNQDGGAYDRLMALAIAKGKTEDEFQGADWPDIESWFAEESPDSGTFAPAGKVPEVKDVVKFSPPDPKNTGKRTKEVDATVTAVDPTAHTVSLQSLVGKKKWDGIAWSDPNLKFDV